MRPHLFTKNTINGKKDAYCITYYHRKVNTKMDGIMTMVCATIWDRGKWLIVVVQVLSDIQQATHSPRYLFTT